MTQRLPVPRQPNDNEDNICACCGYAADDLQDYIAPFPKQDKVSFCEICASTLLSHCVTFPELYGAQRHLLRIHWVDRQPAVGRDQGAPQRRLIYVSSTDPVVIY